MKSELVRLRKLRRLAASTSFPSEAAIARRMAAQVERRLGLTPGAPIEDEDGYNRETVADVTAWQQYVHALPVKAGEANDVRTRYLFESLRVFGHAPLDVRLR